MPTEDVYIGRRCIGTLRRREQQWAAADPEGRQLGLFHSHAEASRAVYQADVAARLAGAAERSAREGDA